MHISTFELFSIGIGPSSSHTVGPMRAAQKFIEASMSDISKINRLNIELFGSLALTGKGHGTDKAVLLGFEGYHADTVDPEIMTPRFEEICQHKQLNFAGKQAIQFDYNTHLIFHHDHLLPKHTNGMRFSTFDDKGQLLQLKVYYSIGGGFILEDEPSEEKTPLSVPYPFSTANELLSLCKKHDLEIHSLMLENERTWRSETDIKHALDHIILTMKNCIEKNRQIDGILPGSLCVKRRAKNLYDKLSKAGKPSDYTQTRSLDWLNMYAIAVNEANAAGDRIVTAPTNGAAGIIPAVMLFYQHFFADVSQEKLHQFLLTAGAIAILYKKGASISGAEVGCQGEVGVASSMAAAALTAVLGGTIDQIENAAEIAMEHHLGMTCDPVAGLVQIPCIERNAMGAVKAVNASSLALLGDGDHYVSLDKVINTMKQTGKDMMTIYKETSQGGLAVNVVEC